MFRFTDIDPAGVPSFRITGIDVAEDLSPDDPFAFVTGLAWVAPPPTEDAGFVMMPIVENTDDFDGDGVIASQDNCPESANPNQYDADGDGIGDVCDTGQTPGEATDLQVLGYHAAQGNIAIEYTPSCQASGHDIHFGPLGEIASYVWSGKVCSIGTNGQFAMFNPGAGSYFFVVTGHVGGVEGSYGLAAPGGERPPNAVTAVCPRVQDISNPCP